MIGHKRFAAFEILVLGLFLADGCKERSENSSAPLAGVSTDSNLLKDLNAQPWIDASGTSEQYFPLFLGASVRDVVLGRPELPAPRLTHQLKSLGESQAAKILQTLSVSQAEFEAWPSIDWNGQPNWVFARWRRAANQPWQWLSGSTHWRQDWPQGLGEKPLFPDLKKPGVAADSRALFADFLEYDNLYQKPLFGNCVYTERSSGAVYLAWPAPREMSRYAPALSQAGKYFAYCMNQPPRFNRQAITFILPFQGGQLLWPHSIEWLPPYATSAPVHQSPLHVNQWPTDFLARYEDDVRMSAGEKPAAFPGTNETAMFIKQGSFQPDNDLERKVAWLEARYRALGLAMERQSFTWRGIPQFNLIVKIRGTHPEAAPVIMADHIDSAVEEDTFEKTKQRVTTRGADDNATATAALLAAAVVLKDSRPWRDIWLVHLTGEEFPADGIGAWHLLSELMKGRQDVHAVVITDFIGWHQAGQNAYQISPNAVGGSERIAALALDAAAKVAPELSPIYQPRDRERNSVFQTDVMEFELYGIPGILFNENMNYADFNGSNPNYHQSTDVAANVDFRFASQIAKVAIETVARLGAEADRP